MRAEACSSCYQKYVCEMVEKPNTIRATVKGLPPYKPSIPLNCFFHCCLTGVTQALEAYNAVHQSGKTGRLIPFGSEHKQYIDGYDFAGRYVVCGSVEGFTDGDVVVRIGDTYKKVTNVFSCELPKPEM